jgi:hypothetical protein
MSRQAKAEYQEEKVNPNSPWGRYLRAKQQQEGYTYARES